MHCANCGGSLTRGATYCPTCGAPAEKYGRPDLSTERIDEAQLRRRRILVFGSAALLVVAVWSQGRSWMSFDSDDRPRDRAPVTATAQELFAAYRDDPGKADDRFGNRVIVVNGSFVRIQPDGGGSPDLRLKTSDPDAPLGVDLLPASHDLSATLLPGQEVSVSCEKVDRTGEERWLRNCLIQAAPPASESTIEKAEGAAKE